MVKYDNEGNLEAALLNDDGTLSERIIESYDYIKFKNDFNRIVEIINTNKMHHAIYNASLEYEINKDLEFILFFDDQEGYMKNITTKGCNGVLTYSMQYYMPRLHQHQLVKSYYRVCVCQNEFHYYF